MIDWGRIQDQSKAGKLTVEQTDALVTLARQAVDFQTVITFCKPCLAVLEAPTPLRKHINARCICDKCGQPHDYRGVIGEPSAGASGG